VDVVFVAPALAPPQVLSTTPAPGARSVPTNFAPTITFSEPIDPASLNASTVLLTNTGNNPVPFTMSYDASNFRVTITPQSLTGGHVFTVTLKGGIDAPHITDATGTPLAADYQLSFRSDPPLILSNWVTVGGTFIALRPDKQFTRLLGLTPIFLDMT
jgi:hypothetical protein